MTTWIKDALLDLIVLVVIAVYTYYQNSVLEIVIWVYTSLILISKILFFFVGFLRTKANTTTVPDLFYHIVYAISVTLLAISDNYYLTGAWLMVWGLSFYASISAKKKS